MAPPHPTRRGRRLARRSRRRNLAFNVTFDVLVLAVGAACVYAVTSRIGPGTAATRWVASWVLAAVAVGLERWIKSLTWGPNGPEETTRPVVFVAAVVGVLAAVAAACLIFVGVMAAITA